MVSDTRYLRQHPKSGRWYVRLAVPKDLRKTYPGAHVERSLRTSDLQEANRRKHAVIARLRDQFDRSRKRLPLGPEEIEREAALKLHRLHDYLNANPISGPEGLGLILFEMQSLDGEGLDYDVLRPEAEKIIARVGADKSEASVLALCDALADAAFVAQEMWGRGQKPPPVPGMVKRHSVDSSAMMFRDAGERYLAERQRDPQARLTEQTATQMRATFRLFADYTSNAPLSAVTRQDAAAFLDTIAMLDPMYGRRPGAASLTLTELLEKHTATEGHGLTNKTINRHQSALKTLFSWARKRGLIEGENPFAELARAKARGKEWLPFAIAELNSLFDGQAFDTKPKKQGFTSALPWIMAVALFSGMRAEEICGLDAEDVKTTKGISYFDITEAKSVAGVRRVPVHSALKRLGFLDYVKAIKTGPLFSGVAPGGPDRKRSHTLAKRFPAFRRDRSVDRDRVAFHSFRKCFVRALEAAGVDRDRAAQVVGHERGFTYRVYNPEGVDMAALREVVEAVTYDGLKAVR